MSVETPGATFAYREGDLYCDDVRLADIAAGAGTPCYVYSARAIGANYAAYDRAFGTTPHRVCYAVKANGNLAVLKLLADAGAGFDIVSGGELFRVLRAGGDAAKVVFSGVGKTGEEIESALSQGIHSFNCESAGELEAISSIAARRGARARVALRVNPDVDAATHPYISTGLRQHKFGVDIAEAESVYEDAAKLPGLSLEGVSCHIGSQLLDTRPILDAMERMLQLTERLRARGFPIRTLDLGGGLGTVYERGEAQPDIAAFVRAICEAAAGHGLEILIEPGRSIAAGAGVLLTRVLYRKKNGGKEFAIVDAAMNDLIRPALYQAHHEILAVEANAETIEADVVGPICETGDFFARSREIPNVSPGGLLAIGMAGAYGFAQSSNYNARPRAAEAMVEGGTWRIVRRRESLEDLVRGETA